MGLDTSHGCWHGSYTYFAAWRCEIARAAGLPPLHRMEGFTESPEAISWDTIPATEPLRVLLMHSDCTGEIAAADCTPLARRLEEILPQVVSGAMYRRTEQFIRGLLAAAKAGEPVVFR